MKVDDFLFHPCLLTQNPIDLFNTMESWRKSRGTRNLLFLRHSMCLFIHCRLTENKIFYDFILFFPHRIIQLKISVRKSLIFFYCVRIVSILNHDDIVR